MKDQYQAIEEKLVKLALDSDDAETIAEIIQAVHTTRELREKKKERSWSAVIIALTPVFSVLIAAVTLLISTLQANRNVSIEQSQAEESEWRDVIKNVSLGNRDSVQTGLFSLQGFFESRSRHADRARSIAVALLPFASSGDGFDIVLGSLLRQPTDSTQVDVLGVGRMVAAHERDLLNRAVKDHTKLPADCVYQYPGVFFKRGDCFEDNSTLNDKVLNDIWLYSWEIGSVSDDLVKLWKRPGGPFGPKGQNLSGVIFDGADLSDLDFSDANLEGAILHRSDLSGTHFNGGTVLSHATFHSIENFEASVWDQAKWWTAASMPCKLAEYLNGKYPAPDQASDAKAKELITSCTKPAT